MFFGLTAHSLATTGYDTNGHYLPFYTQSPMRYGSEMWFQPALMYTAALSVKLFGLTEGTVRLPMALFGIADILVALERSQRGGEPGQTAAIGSLWPTRTEARRAAPAAARGTLVGLFLGLLPGGGALMSSFVAYSLEKRLSGKRGDFGNGDPAGVAAPESANNAGAQSSFLPLLTLGLPSNAVMALMTGAMLIHGIIPGPRIMTNQPGLFWGLIVSMWIGNLMLLVINLPLEIGRAHV